MDIYTIYLTLLSLVFICSSRLVAGAGTTGLRLPVPWLAHYLVKHDRWGKLSPLHLLTMSVLVSVFSCAELDSLYDTDVQRVQMKMKLVDVYKAIVYSFFVLVGIKLKSPIFLGLWLSFTLKNLFREGSYVAYYFFEPVSQNFAVFAIFWTFMVYLWLVQAQWWAMLANVYISMWNDVFDQVSRMYGQCRKPTDADVCLKRAISLDSVCD